MELFYILLVLLFVSRASGEILARAGQPPLVGELLAGIALGVIAHQFEGSLPVLAGLADDEVFTALTDLAIFFLMLLAGVEMSPRELTESSRTAFWVALGGLLLPLGSGFALGWAFIPESDYRFAQSLFLATALAITAVPVSVKVLMDLGKLDTGVGRTIVSAAVFDDVFSLILLAVLTAVLRTGEMPDLGALAILLGRVTLFFLFAGLIGYYVFPWLGKQVKRIKAAEFEFSGLLMAALTFSVFAELLGLHFVLGAFLAGLFFVRRTIDAAVYQALRARIATFTTGFLAPLFFASIGLHLDAAAAVHVPVFVVLLVLVAFAGKLIGAGIPAFLSGLNRRESLGIGAGMSARGAVELIIADIALRAGLFNYPEPPPDVVRYMFSAVVLMALITTLVTPLALQRILSGSRDQSD
jgi:Kef-type K+ transport system membrane component KefB